MFDYIESNEDILLHVLENIYISKLPYEIILNNHYLSSLGHL